MVFTDEKSQPWHWCHLAYTPKTWKHWSPHHELLHHIAWSGKERGNKNSSYNKGSVVYKCTQLHGSTGRWSGVLCWPCISTLLMYIYHPDWNEEGQMQFDRPHQPWYACNPCRVCNGRSGTCTSHAATGPAQQDKHSSISTSFVSY